MYIVYPKFDFLTMRTYTVAVFLLCMFPFFALAQRSGSQQDDDPKKLENTPANFQRLLDSSNNFYNSGLYNRSLALNQDILKMAFAMEDPYYIHQGYRYLAYDYLVLNDTLLAQENMQKSEQYARMSKNDKATAMTFMDMANMYATFSQLDLAMEFHERSINMFRRIGDSTGLAKAHYNAIYTALDAEDLKKTYYHILAAQRLVQFGEHSSFGIGVDLFMAEYLIKNKFYNQAEEYLNKAIEAAKEQELNFELETAYAFLSESLYAQGRYKEAYEAFEVYDEYSDITSGVFSSAERFETTEKIQLNEYRKNVEAAEMQNQLQKQIVESKSRLNMVLMSLCATFLILVVTLLIAFRKRKQFVNELKKKNQEYLIAKEQSEELTELKSKFFSTVSHELRTPLYGVIGLSALLLEEPGLKNHQKDLRSLKFSADYLMALINDVLQMNKIESEDPIEEQTDFHLKSLLESITTSFEYICIQNNNQIKIQIGKTVPKNLNGNPIRLSQILMNLVGNACKFTENGRITIKVSSKKSSGDDVVLRFDVIDTGMGIAKDKQHTIFEEFAQGASVNYNYQGTGLGLPIVKKLLENAGSEIQLKSTLGAGSKFYFDLPFQRSVQGEDQDAPPVVDAAVLVGKRILVAEDNRINQIVTQKILEKYQMFCTVVENGARAVDAIRNQNFDLILMDLNMPVMDGIEASQNIRRISPEIPIIALTAVEVEEVRNDVFDSGMGDIIVKPYDVNKFIQTIIKHIDQVGHPLNLDGSKQVI